MSILPSITVWGSRGARASEAVSSGRPAFESRSDTYRVLTTSATPSAEMPLKISVTYTVTDGRVSPGAISTIEVVLLCPTSAFRASRSSAPIT